MYDLIIIGSGPAGYTAAIYTARYKLNTLVIGATAGGVMAEAHLVENWPGVNSITGMNLTQNFENHIKYFNTPIEHDSVVGITKKDNQFEIKTDTGKTYNSQSILIASGTKKRKLGVPGELELKGKGVSYCATCDAFFFKNKIVVVVGGSDSAGTAALLLADHASKVYLVHRKDVLSCEAMTLERIEKNDKIEIIYNTNITKINGKVNVESVEFDNEFNGNKELKTGGVFIEIGATPSADLARNLGVELDKMERIKIDLNCTTNIEGIFAAGDITVGLYSLNQIITAAASGAIAATSINKFIKTKKISAKGGSAFGGKKVEEA